MIHIRSLTIKSRITPITQGAEGFALRIMGGYRFFGCRITPRDLIHMAVTPYEVFVEQGQSLTLVEQNINLRQQMKAELAGQLINRLLLDRKTGDTYQNRAFISVVLQKLGIRNKDEFIRDVKKSIGLEQETAKLLELYKKKLHVLAVLTVKAQGQAKSRKKKKSPEQETKLYLQDSVFERLKSPLLCSRLYELYKGTRRDFKGAALNFMEHLGQAKRAELMSLRNQLYERGLPGKFESPNPYEWGRSGSTDSAWGTIESKLSAAVLLGMSREASQYAFQEKRPGFSWLELKDTFFQGASTTVERFLKLHRTIQTADMDMQRSMLEQMEEGTAKEVRILRSIEENTKKTKLAQAFEESFKYSRTFTRLIDKRVEKKLSGQWLAAVRETEGAIKKYSRLNTSKELMRAEAWKKAELEEDPGFDLKEPGGQEGEPVREENQIKRTLLWEESLETKKNSVQLEFTQENIKEINRLITNHMQTQMNILTDKVYTKMEKRLLEEKKRRGL